MAEFNLSFYTGEDGYSDGDDTENYIYETVKAGHNLDDIPSDEITWPVFYHLSPIRENICNWYPFKKNARILEIGSGCGAITGVLCQNAEKVTSVELSKRRASINYERNKHYNNLEIIVGNLNDIKLEEKYDYITLIGVLEYAGRFTEGENPFHIFLNNMKRYLKPDGAILIAIENRLGLKYFCGAPEDHTGRLFDGINNYPDYNGVKTFSKSELTDLLKECGFINNRFYYPYPDYKLPNEIFTDYSTNNNKRPYNTYDVDRYSLFWEADMSNSLQKEDVAAVFSNSFFVEARESTECDTSVLYAKLNQDRKEEFRVGTVIYQRDGEKEVEKKPFHSYAISHIARILENDNKKYGNIEAVKGIKHGDSILYPFMQSDFLVDRLKDLALQGKKNEFVDLIKTFFAEVFADAATMEPSEEDCVKVFGDVFPVEVDTKCVCPANIDLSPANVFCADNSFVISDCEWVCDFPVPISFIAWRAIRALYVNVPQISKAITEKELLLEIGIDENQVMIFKKLETRFINDYVCSKGQGIPKTNQFKSLVYGSEEKLSEAVQQYEVQVEEYRQYIQKCEADVENYKESIQQLNYRIKELEIRAEEDGKEIIRVKERVNYLLGRINLARELISTLSNLGIFKLLHLLKRIKGQLLKGSKEERREFWVWIKGRNKNEQHPDPTYNYLLQLDDALAGTGDYISEHIEYPCDISLNGAKRIDIITPGHTLFLARQLSSYLKDAGIQSEIHDPDFNSFEQIPYILICANILTQLPPCYICYQMEQTINSRWLTDKYIGTLENAQAVLDYSRVNTEFFNKYDEIKKKLYYVPMGVNSNDMQSRGALDGQDIDVLFYGDINCDRRKKIIAELDKSFNIHVESNLFGEEMLDVIRRSKVIINIHYYEGALLETPRIAEILALGTSIIVTERSKDIEEEKRFAEFVDFVDVGDVETMKQRISFWLENPNERKTKLENNRTAIFEGTVDSKKYFEEFIKERIQQV